MDNHLSAFAAYEAARTAQLVRQRNEPDEDGFVTVTRGAGGRAAPARLEYAQRTAERLKSRQEKMAGGSFYRFQVREKKKERLKALKRGFQEDLKSVEGMRKKGRVRVSCSFRLQCQCWPLFWCYVLSQLSKADSSYIFPSSQCKKP